MIKKLKSGDLAYYKRQDISESYLVIILNSMSICRGVEYFKCLINNKTENICETWLYSLKQET